MCDGCDYSGCAGSKIPPKIDTHAEFLDDPMAYVRPSDTRALLASHVDAATDAARLLASALSPPLDGEPRFVTRLRQILSAHPRELTALRHELDKAGMSSPIAYRDSNPAPTQAEIDAARARLLTARRPTGAGGISCETPLMRVRVARIFVYEEDDDFLNDRIYCAITSEAADASELKVTPITPPLDEGDGYSYSLEHGLIWGQEELVAPRGNLFLTYNCIEAEGDSNYSTLLEEIAEAANAAGATGLLDVDGWVFPSIGVVTQLLQAALSLDNDDLLFNGSQVVPEDRMLELSNGAWWTVRRWGTNLNSDWDWSLRMEIWGCPG